MGAGISTLLSRALGALVIFWWLRRDPAVRAAWPQRWLGGWSRARFSEMLHVGLPAAGMLLFEASAFAFSSVMIGWLGSVPLAAHQITITCASLAFMFPLGLSMATGMRVSRAVGAGELAARRPIALGSFALGLAIMGTFAVTFGVGGQVIAGWFVTDPVVVALAAQLFVVAALFQMVDGVQVIAAAALRAIMDVRVPAVITFVAYWVLALPLGYALGVRGPWGAPGVWVGIASGLTFAAVFLTVRFVRLTRSHA
jgi:MATE family multidrug resistance protein